MNATETIIFSTSSAADFGFEHIVLTQGSLGHINIGHRDIASLPITLIKEAIEQVTQAYSTHISNRLLFISTNVTRNVHPMAVIVERVEQHGKIITATWKDRITPGAVWESSNGLYSSIDDSADILYLSRGAAVASYAAEDERDQDIWYRFSIDDNSHTGVTIFRVRNVVGLDRSAEIGASFLGISQTQVKERLQSIW